MKKTDAFSSQKTDTRLYIYREKRVSLFSIMRRQTPSVAKGESVSLLYREEAGSFYMKRRKRLSLPYTEEADPFSKKMGRVSLLYRDEVDSFSMKRKRVSLFSILRRQTPSLRKGESVSLLDRGRVQTLFR